jgi:hypothetical protein
VSADISPIADDLLLGAKSISRFLYGNDDQTSTAKVYRNQAALSFFRMGGELCALKSTLRRELAGIEGLAREARKARVVASGGPSEAA